MEVIRIYAGIVTYNPDMDRLRQNIDAILPQVDEVVIFDNGSLNQLEIRDMENCKIAVLLSRENLGIATALNRLMLYGKEKEYSWMLSLDQDSICDMDYVNKMLPFLTIEKEIGIAAPIILDRNVGVVGHNPKEKYKEVNTCITSGAFTKIGVWEIIGGYDEYMFIDSVDFEFCYRVRRAGYKVIQVKETQILHELGESKKRNFLFGSITVNGHSGFRKYYIARNNVYYPLKHHLWLHFVRGNFRNMKMLVLVLLYEEDKWNKIQAICRGWKDSYKTGRRMKSTT